MITFGDFLVQFNEEVEETYEQVSMSKNAKEAVETVMKKYLGNRKFDPIELMELFENACYHAMGKERVDIPELHSAVSNQAKNILHEEPRYTDFPEITFDEAERMRSR